MKRECLLRKVISVVLVLSMLTAFAAPANAVSDDKVTFTEVDNSAVTESLLRREEEAAADSPEFDDTDTVRVSIVLEKDSTISAGYEVEDIALNSEAMSYRHDIRKEQDFITAKIQKTTGKKLDVVWNLTLAANLISANVPYGEISQIEKIPGVESVVIEKQFYPAVHSIGSEDGLNMATSMTQTGTPTAWNSGYTGAGSRIAIVDTGIDINHQSFDSAAFDYSLSKLAEQKQMTTEDYVAGLDLLDKEEIASVASELNVKINPEKAYRGTKIPFGYDYANRNYNVTHSDLAFPGAEHGSHVAGISAANTYIPNGDGTFVDALDSVMVRGVAPEAQLLGMKVFSGATTSESDYMVAIEDAIILGADSINLSLGSSAPGFTQNDTPEYQAILDNLTNSGVVVCISAGNAGNWADNAAPAKHLYNDSVSTHTGGSPGTYTNSLCVASVDNDGGVGQYLDVNGNVVIYNESPNYSNQPFSTLAGDQEYVFTDGLGSSEEWAAVGNAIKDKVVFCERGKISFVEKAENAVKAGARAVVIYNNEPGIIGMNLEEYTKTNPVISITMNEANEIRSASTPVKDDSGTVLYYTGTMTVHEDLGSDQFNSEYYSMSAFSSWGAPGALTMKPEITAPGGNIYSVFGQTAENGGPDEYEVMSGTSMSSPQVAGMAALVMQYIRENDLDTQTDMNPRHLAQSLLMSTAVPALQAKDSYYPVIQQGAGLANVGRAVSADSYITMNEGTSDSWKDGKVKVEWGDDPQREGKYTLSFNINNLTSDPLTYSLNAEFFTQGLIQGPVNTNNDMGMYLDTATRKLDTDVAWSVEDPQNVEVPANGFLEVSVDIALTDAEKATLNETFPTGAFVQGYVFAETKAGSDNAEGLEGTSHSIPCLGYYGSWTEPSMYDVGSYLEYTYGLETRMPYLGDKNTNVFMVSYGDTDGSYYYFGGNPLIEDDTYMPERNAISSTSGDSIAKVKFALTRNAGASRFTVENETTGKMVAETAGQSMVSAFFSDGAASWTNTSQTMYTNYYPRQNVSEGDRLKLSFTAVPEYYVAADGTVAWDQVSDGATIQVPAVVDNTAPEIMDVSMSLTGKLLRVFARDNQYISAVVLFDKSGNNVQALAGADQKADAGQESQFVLDLSDVEGSKFLLQVADYAMNIKTYEVNLQVSDDTPLPDMLAYDIMGSYWINFNRDSKPAGNADREAQFDPYARTDLSVTAATVVGKYLFAAAEDGFLYVMPVKDLTDVRRVGKLNDVVFDMAYNPADGEVYGLTENAIVKIDKLTGTTTKAAPLPFVTNTLACDENGVFYSNEYGTSNVYSYVLADLGKGDMSCDFNEDGYVTCQDVQMVLAYAAELADVPNVMNADFDRDGAITSYDAYLFLKKLDNGEMCGINYLTTVKPAGAEFASMYLQAMEVDPNTGLVCWTSSNSDDASYYIEIDPADGTYEVYNNMIDQLVALAIPQKSSENGWSDPTEQVSGIQISQTEAHILKNNTAQLSAVVMPWTLVDRSVNWTSEDPAIAEVDDNGVVTGLSIGHTTITATSVLDHAFSVTCEVYVGALDVTMNGMLQDDQGKSKFYNWDMTNDTWTVGAEMPCAMVSATQDTLNNEFYVLDGEMMNRIAPDGSKLASAPNGAGVPLWDMAYSPCYSTADAPLVSSVYGYFLLSPMDPMALGTSAFDLSSMVDGLTAITSAGHEKIQHPDTGELLDAEHLIVLENKGNVYDFYLYPTQDGMSALLDVTPSDLKLAYPGVEGMLLCSMVLGDDGNLYLSYFNGESSDVYQLAYNEKTQTFDAQFVDNFGRNVWPVILTSVSSKQPAVQARVPSADAVLLNSVDVSREELAAASNRCEMKSKRSKAVFAEAEADQLAAANTISAKSETVVVEDAKVVLAKISAKDLAGKDVDAANGLYVVEYDPNVLTLVDLAGNADFMLAGGEPGRYNVAYVGTDPIPAAESVVNLMFTYEKPVETCLRIGHMEVNDQTPNYTEKIPLFRENCPSARFADVDPCSYMHKGIDYMVSHNYMYGTSKTTFAPNDALTRAQMLAILYRVAGSPAVSGKLTYTDVPENAYYYKALLWATENKIAAGYSDGTFRPGQKVSRQDFAAFLYRYDKNTEATDSSVLDVFADRNQVSAYAVKAMSWAVANGYIRGVGDTELAPQNSTTRGQTAAILYRYLTRGA